MKGINRELVSLRNKGVSDLLGDDVLHLAGLKNALMRTGGGTPSVARAFQPTPESVQNTVAPAVNAGTKRNADVIDLTESDPL